MISTNRVRPVSTPLMTKGVGVLAVFGLIAIVISAYRFLFGLQSVTNLDQEHPWGLWIAIDVATGVALAAGGFTTAALVHVFHRERFHHALRPALLTAMLGYTFVGLGLMADLGRYYNIWHPMLPSMWQGNSVLIEVGLCVMCYLTVLYIEFIPPVCERFMGDARRPRLARWCANVHHMVGKTMFLFILAGVVLSCLHQSSLGNLMVIAPSKMHPLWYSPILAWLFLLSAICVGFPMVILESLYASWSLGLKPELKLLSALARFIPPMLGLYLAFKLGDMFIRESQVYLDGSMQSLLFVAELGFGVVLPLGLLLSPRVRNSTRGLLASSLLIVLGVALNRVNVFLVAYQPPFASRTYFPSISEILVTIGLFSLLILTYRMIVTYLPIIAHEEKAGVV